jgi:rhodanese-related sulfurtransferase
LNSIEVVQGTSGHICQNLSIPSGFLTGPPDKRSLLSLPAAANQPEGMMAKNVKDMLAEANSVVPKLSPAEAVEKIRSGDVLVVDVRDPTEVQQSGKIKGAVNVSRGMLEFRADPESQYHNSAFQKDKTILLHCASGGRSALAGKTLQDMGYTDVFNIGSFKDLAEAGIDTEPA